MYVLGISAFYHDSASCILKDGDIIAAVQEERFTRIKHDPNFPTKSIEFCLNEAQIEPSHIDYIVFYEKPFLKFERLIETYLAFAPKGFNSFCKSMPLWVKDKLFQRYVIQKELDKIFEKNNWKGPLLFSEHHLSHASSAFFPSAFEEAAILTIDGVGEWSTTSLAVGKKNKIDILKEIYFPHSLGLLYSAFTYYTGFKVNSGEYKLMGLAPYGEPKYTNIIKDNLIDIKKDGSFQLNMDFFDYCTGIKMTNSKFNKLFNGKPRKPETKLTQKEMDIAASIQLVTEEVILNLVNNISKQTGQKNLCLAGGVALNCVANGKILKEKIFDNIWIQPAAGDAGGSLGAALALYYNTLSNHRNYTKKDKMHGSYLGPDFDNVKIRKELTKVEAKFDELPEDELINYVAKNLSEGKAVGWFQGKMEFGPRALGNRSILADPRSPQMQKNLNLKIKFRESFRPFAPSILLEDLNDWFDISSESPYMLLVADVKKEKRKNISAKQANLFGFEKLNVERSLVPAITHVDYSSRIQTVDLETNPKYYKLISKFKEISGCPILINTSFNIRGEPIVCTPKNAFKCFMGTELDILVINNFLIIKDEQNKKLFKDYKNTYELD